tara:strand:+ start:471 stop:833 length:363 start_codon:yes stop_codon:yes gene_type:complete
MSSFEFLPNTADLISTALAAASSFFLKQGTPTNAALEQLVSIIAGKNVANNTAFADVTDGEGFYGSTVLEYDLFTGAARGGYSAFKKRGTNVIAMDAGKGVLCNVAGRMIAKAISPEPVA